jgi:hypothetical protein
MRLPVTIGTERNAVPDPVALLNSEDVMYVQKAGKIPLGFTALALPDSSLYHRCPYARIGDTLPPH